MAKTADTFNRKSKYNSVIYNSDFFVIKHLEVFLNNAINLYIYDGMVIADIGCGEQPLRDLIESKGCKYVGIDISQNAKMNIDVIASITNIPIPDNTFDCIICTEVLEHVVNTHLAFIEMKRLIKKGGCLIITTPFCYPLHEEPYDYVRLTRHYLLAEADANKLSIVSNQESGNEIEVIATLLSSIFNPIKKNTLITKICNSMIRFLINAVSYTISSLFCKFIPRKIYLNNMLILKK